MDYRIFYLDSNGRIAGRLEFDAGDDGAARLAANQLADGRSMELWQGGRFVDFANRQALA